MSKEKLLFDFMQKVWNEQRKELVETFVHKEYKIHLDTADPWEGKILNHTDFKKEIRFFI